MIILDGKYVSNFNLFSNYFLESLLLNTDLWKSDEFARASQEIFNVILDYFEREKTDLPSYSEAQLENRFIQPILERLGHSYDVQVPIVVKQERKKPDYAFFSTESTRKMAREERRKLKKRSIYFKRVSLIGEAKKWAVNFDERAKNVKKFDDNSPSFQLIYYMTLTKCKWGILTNGQHWRLYNREYGLDAYLSINLTNIIIDKNISAFRYFFFFFSNTALQQDHQGYNWLDRSIEQSIEHKKSIGDNLKEKMVDCVEVITNGFIQTPSNNIDPNDIELPKLYEESLILLYRLLFILYAEYRELLPLDNDVYKLNFSLYQLKHEVKDILETSTRKNALLITSTQKWQYLRNLFKLLNEGSQALSIPSNQLSIIGYNGGLFDPSKHEFLEQNSLNDIAVCELIRHLTWARTNGSSQTDFVGFIDYSELSVRHLGSIYEGLLEFHLEIANEPLVVLRGSKNNIISKTEAVNNNRRFDREISIGNVFLANEKLQRKITGSYYTPENIVNFMVNRSIGPILRQFRQKEKTVEEYIQQILSLRIIDPAMGSGHFLVSTVDYLANEILSAPLHFVEASSEERTSEEEGVYQLKLLQEYRQLIAQYCIYGIDKNPLAVELAKVSIWIHTAIKDQPLHFLDHHLKCGDSLLGASLHRTQTLDLAIDERQRGLDEFLTQEASQLLVNSYREINQIPARTVQDMREKEEKYLKFLDIPLRRNYVDVCDVYLNHFLGTEIDESNYQQIRNAVKNGREEFLKLSSGESWYKDAEERREIENFFHWELEFPDIFLSEKGGFDVCIGNPPHGAKFPSYTWIYLQKFLSPYLNGRSIHKESGVYFSLRSALLIHSRGVLNFILPKPTTYAVPHEPFRDYISKNYNILDVLDLGCAFEGQLQEQFILMFSQPTVYRTKEYRTGYRDKRTNEILITGRVPKETAESFKLFFLSFDPDEIQIGKQFASNHFENLQIEAHRGLPTRYRKNVGVTPLYEKRDIGLGYLKNPRYFVDMDRSEDSQVSRQRKPKIVTQRILSYKTDPYYSLWANPYVDREGKIITQETAMNIYSLYPEGLIPLSALAAILLSDVIRWYLTRFIYTKRFETSKDFDKHYIRKIRIPKFKFKSPSQLSNKRISSLKIEEVKKLESKDIIKALDYWYNELSDNKQSVYDQAENFIEELLKLIGISWEKFTGKRDLQLFYTLTPEDFVRLVERNLGRDPQYDHTKILQLFDNKRKIVAQCNDQANRILSLINALVYQLYRLDNRSVAIIQEALGSDPIAVRDLIQEMSLKNANDILDLLRTGLRTKDEHEALVNLINDTQRAFETISEEEDFKDLLQNLLRDPIINQDIYPRH